MKLTIETDEPEGADVITGLHQGWISGKADDGTTFEVSCGAGLGSPHIKLFVTLPDGTDLYDHANIAPMVEEWVNRLRDQYAQSDEAIEQAADAHPFYPPNS